MASLERRNATYRVVFRHGGKKHGFSLNTADRATAEALRGGVEKTLMMLTQGLLPAPRDADLISFVPSGGKADSPPNKPPTAVTFAQLRDAYLAAHANGVVEASSLATIRQHLRPSWSKMMSIANDDDSRSRVIFRA